MKTSLIIPDSLYRQVRRRAADRGITISELVTECLRIGLNQKRAKKPLPPLPTYDMGPPLVDISDRNALYEAIDRERDERLYPWMKRDENVRR